MKTRIMIVLLTLFVPLLSWPSANQAQETVQIGRQRHVIPGHLEPNTPGAPGVEVDPALAAAVTDPAAFDEDGSLNLNQAVYVRFFDQTRAAPPDAILVMIPGVVAGANSYKIVAGEIVRLSEGRFEVWAIDRRSNLLEDLRPMVAAENELTMEAARAALDAYANHPAGPGGFIFANRFAASRFMSEWGLDVHLRDFRAVVEQARTVTQNVLLGGHSLGAILAQMFAAYNFGDVAGFELIRGMMILDGTADVTGAAARPVSDSVYLDGGDSPLGPLAGLRQLRAPTTPEHAPYVIEPFNPFLFQLVEIGAQLVLLDPDGPSVLREVVPDLIPVPMTNAAALGINLDDEFQEQIFARFSIGFLDVPTGRTAGDVATQRNDPTRANPNGLWTPRNLSPALQEWAPLKDLSPLGRTFSSRPEPSDFEIVARAFLLGEANQTAAIEDTNFIEWYMPSRLVLDIAKVIDLGRAALSATVIAAQTERGGNPITLTENGRVNVPLLAIRAQEGGFVTSNLGFVLYRNSTSIPFSSFTVNTMQNYAHVDMLTSLEKRSINPADSNVPELIVDFVSRHLP